MGAKGVQGEKNVTEDKIVNILIRKGVKNIFRDTKKILKELKRIIPSRYLFYPCHIIDLKGIFREGYIEDFSPIPLFSYGFAEKYLKRYSIFLEIDSKKIEDKNFQYGGVDFIFADKICTIDNLNRIIVNAPYSKEDFDIVKKIMKEYGIEIECLASNTIPALSQASFQGEIKQVNREDKMLNWYKKAQSIPVGEIIEGTEIDANIDIDITKGPDIEETPYRKGMRVRDRRRGMVNPQEYGTVEDIRGTKMTILWNPDEKKEKRHKDVFDIIEDTEILSLIVAEV